MEGLIEFFGASSPAEAVYWLTAVGSTAFLGIRFLFGFLGLELDHDLDFEIAGLDVSVSAFVAFLSIGGWTGVFGYTSSGLPALAIHVFAALAGSGGFFLSLFMYSKLRSLENTGNLLLDNAIGKVGKVYLGIPEERTGNGQVEIIVQGRLVVLDAITDGKKIPTGQKIIVYSTEEGKLLVEPYSETNIELSSTDVKS